MGSITKPAGVTIKTADHPPRRFDSGYKKSMESSDALLGQCSTPHRKGRILQSSFTNLTAEDNIFSSSNGFVWAATYAYSGHHHLVIRPEDVWFAILNQLGLWINGHAEEVRDLFVEHEGQKELRVVRVGSLATVDMGDFAVDMTKQIASNIKDPELRRWMMPDFSTTTSTDCAVAAFLMMGALQKYFDYTFQLTCGIPSVTLLGTRDDWQKLVDRLPYLDNLGKEPTEFKLALKPVLELFVKCFDDPTSEEVIDFWGRVAHEMHGSGMHDLSGWITAFTFWDSHGKRMYSRIEGACSLADSMHTVDAESVPYGYMSVPVKVDDNGVLYQTQVVAGSVGIKAVSSGEPLDTSYSHSRPFMPPQSVVARCDGAPGLDTIQPITGWWMYEQEAGDQ